MALTMFGIIMTAVVGALTATVHAQREKMRTHDEQFKIELSLLAKGMRVLMRSELFRLHEEYVQVDRPVPLDVKEQANSVHDVYAGLGGNGVGSHLWQELMDAHTSSEKENSND